MPTNLPSRRLARRLVMAMLVPAALGFAAFGFFAHEVARRSLEDELGRRLAATAVGVAAQILPEQLTVIAAGDEDSRTYANLRHRIEQAQARFGVRRIVLVARDLGGRGDTAGRVALGARAHELSADRDEIESAARGKPRASPLFTGRDGQPRKRAYAAIGAPDDAGGVTGLVAVEGDADFYEPLSRFRRWLALWGVVSLGVLVVITMALAGRITGPLARLAGVAARIGRGELEQPVPVETRDEIGLLARRLDEMRAALRARDERLQMMLAGIAHEVRNPLGGLELFAGLLREGLAEQPERLREVERLEREIAYLNAVVSEFLDYARRPPPEPQTLALGALLSELRDVEGGLTVDVPTGLQAKADPTQLRRALLNLVRNARQAAGPEGRVVAAARAQPGAGPQGIVIEVRDSGPGVPDELQESIFAPFFTTREKGTGLGLAFVRDITRDHGGSLAIERAPEGGACFRIML